MENNETDVASIVLGISAQQQQAAQSRHIELATELALKQHVIDKGTSIGVAKAMLKEDVANANTDIKATAMNTLGGDAFLDSVSAILKDTTQSYYSNIEQAKAKKKEFDAIEAEGTSMEDIWRNFTGRPSRAVEAISNYNKELVEITTDSKIIRDMELTFKSAVTQAEDLARVSSNTIDAQRQLDARAKELDIAGAQLLGEDAKLTAVAAFNANRHQLSKEATNEVKNSLVQAHQLRMQEENRRLIQDQRKDTALARKQNATQAQILQLGAQQKVLGTNIEDLAKVSEESGEQIPESVIVGMTAATAAKDAAELAGYTYNALLAESDGSPEMEAKLRDSYLAFNEAKLAYGKQYSATSNELYMQNLNFRNKTVAGQQTTLKLAQTVAAQSGSYSPTNYTQVEQLIKKYPEYGNAMAILSKPETSPTDLIVGTSATEVLLKHNALKSSEIIPGITKMFPEQVTSGITAASVYRNSLSGSEKFASYINTKAKNEAIINSGEIDAGVSAAQLGMFTEGSTKLPGLSEYFKLSGEDFKSMQSNPLAVEYGTFLNTAGESANFNNMATFYKDEVYSRLNKLGDTNEVKRKHFSRVQAEVAKDLSAAITVLYQGKFSTLTELGFPVEPMPVVAKVITKPGATVQAKFKVDLSDPNQLIEVLNETKPGVLDAMLGKNTGYRDLEIQTRLDANKEK